MEPRVLYKLDLNPVLLHTCFVNLGISEMHPNYKMGTIVVLPSKLFEYHMSDCLSDHFRVSGTREPSVKVSGHQHRNHQSSSLLS